MDQAQRAQRLDQVTLAVVDVYRELGLPVRAKQIAERSRERKKPAFLFVNNRLEGNAPSTIEAVVEQLWP